MPERFRKIDAYSAHALILKKAQKNRLANRNFIKHWSEHNKEETRLPQQLEPEIPVIIAEPKVEIKKNELDEGAFLAGFFESRGHMNIYAKKNKRKRKNGNTYSYVSITPSLAYNDSDKEKIEKLKKRFGGSSHKLTNKNSYRWSISGKRAVEIARIMQPYTQKRLEMTYAFTNWENSNMDEREHIVRELRNKPEETINPESYSEALENPSFLAGIFESGGLDELTGSKRSHNITIYSTNPILLEAMCDKWGGRVVHNKVNSNVLKMKTASSKTFSQEISPYLIST